MWASVENLRDSYNPRADEAIAAASHILWALSGRKFSGMHNVTELYDVRNGVGWLEAAQAQAVFQATSQSTFACVSCGYPHRMRLRHQPVQRVLSVEINGQAVAPADYALLNHSTLGFPYGSIAACSATCVRVSYVWGVNPPPGGRTAAAVMADQFLLAWEGDDSCRFPRRITSVTRQQVSWTIMDPQDFLEDGRTGIYEIDLFLKSVNPDKARKPARVFSPDVPRASTVVQQDAPPSVEITSDDLGVIAAGSPAWYVVPAASWPGVGYTPIAIVGDDSYGADHFTTNTDGSLTFALSAQETFGLSDGDPFSIEADPTAPGSNTVVSSGYVRFVS